VTASEPPIVRLAANAMRVRFEIALFGRHPEKLRSAGEEAIEDLHRIENDLSAWNPGGDISRLNAAEPESPVLLQPTTIAFLRECIRWNRMTRGCFEPTVMPLMQLWGLTGDARGSRPAPEAIAVALHDVGIDRLVRIDDDTSTAMRMRSGAWFDPGAIGKGWAIDRMVELLRESGVDHALVHGGTSSVAAIGGPLQVRIAGLHGPHALVELHDSSLGVSGTHGKGFVDGDRFLGHVLDPRTGEPIVGSWVAAVEHRSATAADALSTALWVDPHCVSPDSGMLWSTRHTIPGSGGV